MASSPSQFSLTQTFATWRGLWALFGMLAAEMDPWRAIHAWVDGIFNRLDAMLLQFRAGTLAAADTRPGREMRGAPMRAAAAEGCASLGGVGLRVLAQRADSAADIAGAASCAAWASEARSADSYPQVTWPLVPTCVIRVVRRPPSGKTARKRAALACAKCSGL